MSGDGVWALVKFSGREAWVQAAKIDFNLSKKINSTVSSKLSKIPSGAKDYICQRVALRENPETDSKSIKLIFQNQQVKKIGRKGNWIKVSLRIEN